MARKKASEESEVKAEGQPDDATSAEGAQPDPEVPPSADAAPESAQESAGEPPADAPPPPADAAPASDEDAADDPTPDEVRPVRYARVLRAARWVDREGTVHHLAEGSVVSELTHDVPELHRQGVLLGPSGPPPQVAGDW